MKIDSRSRGYQILKSAFDFIDDFTGKIVAADAIQRFAMNGLHRFALPRKY